MGQTLETDDCMSCTTATSWCHLFDTREIRSTRKARPSFSNRSTEAEALELELNTRLMVLTMTTQKSMTLIALLPYSSISPGPSTTSLKTVSTKKTRVNTTFAV
jgi:hypothetical protein